MGTTPRSGILPFFDRSSTLEMGQPQISLDRPEMAFLYIFLGNLGILYQLIPQRNCVYCLATHDRVILAKKKGGPLSLPQRYLR